MIYLPENIIAIPKIESPLGVKNIEEIIDNLELDEEIDEKIDKDIKLKNDENKDYFDNISECSDLDLEEKVEDNGIQKVQRISNKR